MYGLSKLIEETEELAIKAADMKIAVFMDTYLPLHETRDPGLIPLGLKEIGVESELLTLRKNILANYKTSFPVLQTTWDELTNDAFWAKYNSDAVVAYTWINSAYTPLVEKIKASGKKVILKADTDGRIGYPLVPVRMRIPLLENITVENITGHVLWQLPFKSLHHRSAGTAAERIKQIELSDGVIVESPDALANLNYFLAAWGRKDLIKKTHFVPDPVTPDVMNAEIGKKENILVTFGRWEALAQKNTKVMVESVAQFLEERKDYTAVIFGSGGAIVKSFAQNIPKPIADRMTLLGFVERRKIKQILSTAKIFYTPSRWESFGIAAAESLCMGCSLTAGPVESLRYLAMQGFSGTIASDFTENAFSAALIEDSTKWDRGFYKPEKTAQFWRTTLDRKNIAENIAEITRKLLAA